MPEAHRAITRAAHEHVAWRRRHVQQVGASDLLTVTYFLDKCLPPAELFLVSEPMRDLALTSSGSSAKPDIFSATYELTETLWPKTTDTQGDTA